MKSQAMLVEITYKTTDGAIGTHFFQTAVRAGKVRKANIIAELKTIGITAKYVKVSKA